MVGHASLGVAILRSCIHLQGRWTQESSRDKLYEGTVDLKSRQPRDVECHMICFEVDGARLYVDLVSLERRKSDEPSIGPRDYCRRKVTQIYPDQARHP